MLNKKLMLLLLLAIAPLCYGGNFCYSFFGLIGEDEVDNIFLLSDSDPEGAGILLDSLRAKVASVENMAKFEAVAAKIYNANNNHVYCLKSCFASLAYGDSKDEDVLPWHLMSLNTLSHQYVRSQNWMLSARYMQEMEQLSRGTEYEPYYHSSSLLLRSLVLMMQDSTSQALAVLDLIPDIMSRDTAYGFENRVFEIQCRTQQYRANINGFGGEYDICLSEQMALRDLLMSEDSVLMCASRRYGYLLYCYGYTSYLCFFLDSASFASACYDSAIVYREKLVSGNRNLRLLADYLLAAERFDELDSLLLPVLSPETSSNTILHEQDHLMKLYIRSLYKRNRQDLAAEWVERYMDSTRLLFLENGQRGVNEFRYAYLAEMRERELLEQKAELLHLRMWLFTAIMVMLLLVVAGLLVYYLFVKQRRDNRFLYDRMNELNLAYNKISKLVRGEQLIDNVKNEERRLSESQVVVQRIHDYLLQENRFLNKDLSADQVQLDCGISYDTMNRRLNSAIGMTFSEYLCHLRLEYACRLLSSTNDTIDSVADSSGFNSTRTFQRQFKEKYNLSPSQYRKFK